MRTETIAVPVMRTGAHPLLRLLAAFPIACFCGALATDIAYVLTSNMIWADFSAWLLAAGLGIGALAALVAIVDLARHRRTAPRGAWLVVLGSAVVLLVALIDNLVHSRDAWTSVMPDGLALSAVTVIVMLVTIWTGAAAARANPVAMTRNIRP